MQFDETINNFFSNQSLDLSIRGPLPRFLDQKVQPDVLTIVSRSIAKLFSKDNIWFTRKELQTEEFTNSIVKKYFGKPDTKEVKAANEYDKFFGQILNFLRFYNVLNFKKQNNLHYYQVKNLKVIRYISNDTHNSNNFITLANKNFIQQNKLSKDFDKFFNSQTNTSLNDLKIQFKKFLHSKTNIKKDYEVGRIFTPFLNPLAFEKNKYGTEKGRLSRVQISFTDLLYARTNWKDLTHGKPKNITRKEWLSKIADEEMPDDNAEKIAKDDIKERHKDISEYSGQTGAIHTHHIFPKFDFEKLKSFKENLIRLTPNEHLVMAHPDGKTQQVDTTFQKELLKAKLKSINESLKLKDGFYDLKYFINAINIGFNKNLPTDMSLSEIKKHI